MLGLANISICARELDEALCRTNVPDVAEYAQGYRKSGAVGSSSLSYGSAPRRNNLLSLWQFVAPRYNAVLETPKKSRFNVVLTLSALARECQGRKRVSDVRVEPEIWSKQYRRHEPRFPRRRAWNATPSDALLARVAVIDLLINSQIREGGCANHAAKNAGGWRSAGHRNLPEEHQEDGERHLGMGLLTRTLEGSIKTSWRRLNHFPRMSVWSAS